MPAFERSTQSMFCFKQRGFEGFLFAARLFSSGVVFTDDRRFDILPIHEIRLYTRFICILHRKLMSCMKLMIDVWNDVWRCMMMYGKMDETSKSWNRTCRLKLICSIFHYMIWYELLDRICVAYLNMILWRINVCSLPAELQSCDGFIALFADEFKFFWEHHENLLLNFIYKDNWMNEKHPWQLGW